MEAMEFKSFFKTVGGNEGGKCKYPTRLDLYGCGCQHDCSYCYARSLLDFRKMWNPQRPRVADGMKVYRTIKRRIPEGSIVRLGGMTDCFQPMERENKATYNAIKELNEKGVGYLIVTKSDLVASDEYIALMRKDLAHIQITVTATDDGLCKTYEKATPPSKRIAAIEKLYKEGFDVALRLSPFIPQFIGRGLDIEAVNNVECEKILVEFLRVNAWVKKWFDIDYSEYTLKQSGYEHLPLEKKIEYLKLIDKTRKKVTVCEDVDEHFKFWRESFNPDKEDCCNLDKRR